MIKHLGWFDGRDVFAGPIARGVVVAVDADYGLHLVARRVVTAGCDGYAAAFEVAMRRALTIFRVNVPNAERLVLHVHEQDWKEWEATVRDDRRFVAGPA